MCNIITGALFWPLTIAMLLIGLPIIYIEVMTAYYWLDEGKAGQDEGYTMVAPTGGNPIN